MIRPAQITDLPRLAEIYEDAKVFMHENGNPTQWAGGYPNLESLTSDLEKGLLYTVESDEDPGRIAGAFSMLTEPDPTYAVIYDGAWLSDTPYAAIHAVVSDRKEKGMVQKIMAFVRESHDHIRVDTHKDNLPMQGALKRDGFTYQGVIICHDGTPRVAYEWMK
ncbi:MAG: GNAT family N-acetyltransferase [Eubacterium sp.]|nr:GNAT family N-acetyltransferase [Eubacterium sp.]